MAISVLGILRNSIKFSAVQAIAVLIGAPVAIYVATILSPEKYGVYGFLGLWLSYAGLIGPGITWAAQREVPVLLGNGEGEKASAVQNVSISAEMLFAIIPFVGILAASFFFSDPILRLGLIIVAATYLVGKLASLWSQMNFVRQKFNIVAVGNLIVAILTPLVAVVSIKSLGVYALLIAPLIASAVTFIYYLKRGSIHYRFAFGRTEILRLIKVGIFIQGLALVFWAFRLTDRTIIASELPLEQLGLYTYAMAFLMYALTIPNDFGNVLQPILYREAAKADSVHKGFGDTKRLTVYLALGASIAIPLAQLIYYLIIKLITVKYVGSIPIFHVLSYNLYLTSIALVPGIILTSSFVNKQQAVFFLYLGGLALNVIFGLLVIRLGYGVVGIAWVTICTQGLVTLITYILTKGYIFENTKEFLKFLARIILPFLITIPFYFFHDYLSSITSKMWEFAGLSLAAQAIVWSLTIGIFYRDYLSINHIKAVMREVNIPALLRLRRR